MMHPVLEQVKAALGDRIRIIKVDVDKHPHFRSRERMHALEKRAKEQNAEPQAPQDL